jgi:hypothetical protein
VIEDQDLRGDIAPMKLYKLKPISQFKYICDIIVNKRLYAAQWEQLNDPMEFAIRSNTWEGLAICKEVNSRLFNLRVCSLSETYKDIRMWAYYAEGFNGIALGFEIDGNDTRLSKVRYTDRIHTLDPSYLDGSKDKEIYNNKFIHWEWEKEWRLVTDKKYIENVSIKEVLIGHKVRNSDADLIKKMVALHCGRDARCMRVVLDMQHSVAAVSGDPVDELWGDIM